MPQNLICFWKASDMKLLPWSWRSARPRAAPAGRGAKCWRTALPAARVAPQTGAELLADRHADGLDRLEAGAELRHVPAEQLGVPVLGDAEQPDLAILDGGDLGAVAGPHDVRRRGDDVPVVRPVGPGSGPMRRQQGVLAHQPQHAPARHPDAVHRAQPGPHLAVALAGPRRARE